MNNIKILGRLTNAPEHKTATNGRTYAFFTVAAPRQSFRRWIKAGLVIRSK